MLLTLSSISVAVVVIVIIVITVIIIIITIIIIIIVILIILAAIVFIIITSSNSIDTCQIWMQFQDRTGALGNSKMNVKINEPNTGNPPLIELIVIFYHVSISIEIEMSFWQIFRHWLHQTLLLGVSVWKADLVSAKQKDMYVVASITGCPANLSTDVPPWIETIILLWSGISAIHIQYGFKSVSNKANHLQWMARAFILSSVSSSGHMWDVGKVITYHSAVQRAHV